MPAGSTRWPAEVRRRRVSCIEHGRPDRLDNTSEAFKAKAARPWCPEDVKLRRHVSLLRDPRHTGVPGVRSTGTEFTRGPPGPGRRDDLRPRVQLQPGAPSNASARRLPRPSPAYGLTAPAGTTTTPLTAYEGNLGWTCPVPADSPDGTTTGAVQLPVLRRPRRVAARTPDSLHCFVSSGSYPDGTTWVADGVPGLEKVMFQ